MKTTTFAVLVLGIVATVRQRRHAEAFGRRIADSLVFKAGTLGLCYLGVIASATFLLLLSESAPMSRLLFEVVSATTVTGLSLGVTADLTSFGKTVIIACMFLGRIGPLALLAALMIGMGRDRPYAYPHEDVVIG